MKTKRPSMAEVRANRSRAAYKGIIKRLHGKISKMEADHARKLYEQMDEKDRAINSLGSLKQVVAQKLCIGSVVFTNEEARKLKLAELDLKKNGHSGLYT